MNTKTNSPTPILGVPYSLRLRLVGLHNAAAHAGADYIRVSYSEMDAIREGLDNAAAQSARIAELERALDIIVLNATIQPDARMEGATDCYAVPLDDIESARALLAKKEG